jgi:hypothetical protein
MSSSVALPSNILTQEEYQSLDCRKDVKELRTIDLYLSTLKHFYWQLHFLYYHTEQKDKLQPIQEKIDQCDKIYDSLIYGERKKDKNFILELKDKLLNEISNN